MATRGILGSRSAQTPYQNHTSSRAIGMRQRTMQSSPRLWSQIDQHCVAPRGKAAPPIAFISLTNYDPSNSKYMRDASQVSIAR